MPSCLGLSLRIDTDVVVISVDGCRRVDKGRWMSIVVDRHHRMAINGRV